MRKTFIAALIAAALTAGNAVAQVSSTSGATAGGIRSRRTSCRYRTKTSATG